MATQETNRLAQLEAQVETLRNRLAEVEKRAPEDSVCLLVISGEMERVMTALMLAHAAAAVGLKVSMFFAFWGALALRRDRVTTGKTAIESSLGAMMPKDISGLPSSKFNFAGLGPILFRKIMEEKGILNPQELLAAAPESGIALKICPTSIDMFGLKNEELLPNLAFEGATAFLEAAGRARFSGVF